MDKAPNGYKCLRCDADLFRGRRKWCSHHCQHNTLKKESGTNGHKCLRCDADLFGIRRKWCSIECQHGKIKKQGELSPYRCLQCNAELSGKKRKYCNALCGARHRLNQVTQEQRTAERRASSPYKAWCECCYKLFNYKQGGTNKKAGYRVRFCSMSCRVQHGDKVRLEREAIRRIGVNCRAYSRKITPKPPKPIKEKPVVVKHCQVCASIIDSGRKKFCSQECAKQSYKKTETYREHKKAWRQKRKAVERGAVTAVKFKPRDIFDRDGWLCQICGIKTPESLRGSHKPNAPELDHIIPLSKGGAHHPSNCQTSCRSCNNKKADGMPVGQRGLFTSLIAA